MYLILDEDNDFMDIVETLEEAKRNAADYAKSNILTQKIFELKEPVEIVEPEEEEEADDDDDI